LLTTCYEWPFPERVESPTMSLGQALFQSILDAPDDDGPRLVYADWLDERGDPERAEFIRLEVKRFRQGRARCRGRDPDSERHANLERNCSDRWLGEMPKFPGVRWWAFWRGFPTVQVDGWPTLKKYGAKIWAASPCEELCLARLTPQGARCLAKSVWLTKVRVFSVNWVGSHFRPGFREFLRWPALGHLYELDLKSAGLGDEGARLLAECPHFTNLEILWLECNDISGEGARAFAGTPHFPKLRRLILSRNPFEGEADQKLKKRWGRVVNC
jgi:uncharacterized protein (TIGR02996 family)